MLEPCQMVSMRSMVTDAYPNEPFAEDNFEVQTVLPGRTFLEKVFLLHEEFTRPDGCSRCDRLTRHLYDVEKMMDEDFAIEAMNNEALYNDIVKHRKSLTAWSGLNYHTHAPSMIAFLPPSELHEKLKSDYSLMQQGFIYGKSLPFDDLLKRITELQERFRELPIRFDIEE